MKHKDLGSLLSAAPCRRMASALALGLLLLPAATALAEEESEEFIKSSLGFYQAEDTCVFGAIKASGGNSLGALEACSQQFDAHQAHLKEVYNNRAVKVFMALPTRRSFLP